jgi:hypothetical protein
MNRPKLYQVCDLVIESSIFLPELAAASAPVSAPDYSFELLPPGDPFPGEYRWFNHWVFREEVRLSFAFRDEDYLLRFPDQADFLVSRAGPKIRCRSLPDVPESTIRHLLLDSVIPLILSRREPLVLHASAILMGNSVIGFVGTSGQGKSTLAASHSQLGYPLISDDYLVLRHAADEWVAVPSYPGVRLLPKASDEIFEMPLSSAEVAPYTEKRRISDLRYIPFTKDPSKMQCLYVLDDEGEPAPREPAVERISPRQTFMKLVSSSFNMDITDRNLLRRHFDTLKQLVASLPCFRLRYAREFGVLRRVSKVIAAHQEGLREMSIALTDRVKVTDDVLSSRMGDETVLLNLKTGMYHGLDVVGTRFFELLKSTTDLGGIHRELLSEFDVPPDRLEVDLLALAEEMHASGILVVSKP